MRRGVGECESGARDETDQEEGAKNILCLNVHHSSQDFGVVFVAFFHDLIQDTGHVHSLRHASLCNFAFCQVHLIDSL